MGGPVTAATLFGIALLVYGRTPAAGATTWRVARDGSGQFSVIQPALDAAAPGDTVFIGPGHYTETNTFQTYYGGDQPSCAGVAVDGLTILGAHRDLVLIGPDAFDPHQMGLVMRMGAATGLRVSGVTLQNLLEGVFCVGEFEMRESRVRGCALGVNGHWASKVTLRDCVVEDSREEGLAASGRWNRVFIERCLFNGARVGVINTWLSNLLMQDTVVRGGWIGVHVASEASATLRACQISGAGYAGVTVASGSRIELSACDVGGVASGALVWDARISGTTNLFRGGSRAAMEFLGRGIAVDLRNNTFVKGDSLAVIARGYLRTIYGKTLIDLRQNRWGTTDEGLISQWIWDARDDSTVAALVEYSPIQSNAVPSRSQSLSRLKQAYRPR